MVHGNVSEWVYRRLCILRDFFLSAASCFHCSGVNSIEMASKRIATTAIDWAAFAERVPKSDLPYFQALKGRNEAYMRRVAAHPSSLPKIDWSYYKSRIAVPGMVDTFQKAYETLNIPYPKDQGLIEKINQQDAERKADLAKFTAAVNEQVQELKEKLKKMESELRYSEMTVEEYFIACPEQALYPVNPPTFYPHGEEEKKFTQKLVESGKL